MKHQVIITHRLDTGSTFAVRIDNGEQVFIPPAVAIPLDLQNGEKRELALVQNTPDLRERTPWQAIIMNDEPDRDRRDIVQDVQDTIAAGGIWTNASMFSELYEGAIDPHSSEYKDVGNALARLHTAGKIAMATINSRRNQEKATALLYAANANTLIGGIK